MSATTAPTIRQSFAATFDRCPQAANLSQSYPGASSHAQARGTLLHKLACWIVETCIARNERVHDPDDAKERMRVLAVESGLPVGAEEFDVLMGLAWKFAAEHQFDIENIVDLEEQYTSEVAGVTITGRPDVVEIVDRVATVRDYKTSFVIDPEADLDGTFQARFYAKLIFDAYPHVHAVRLSWEYVRWGAIREALIGREDLPELELYLEALVKRIVRSRARDEWPAVPGSWCSICPAPDECPLVLAERRDGAPTDTDLAIEYGKQAVAMEALLKLRKKQLRDWCGEHGGLVIGDMEWGFTLGSDSERVIDKPALRDAMEAVGLDWHAFFQTVKGSSTFKARKVKAGA